MSFFLDHGCGEYQQGSTLLRMISARAIGWPVTIHLGPQLYPEDGNPTCVGQRAGEGGAVLYVGHESQRKGRNEHRFAVLSDGSA